MNTLKPFLISILSILILGVSVVYADVLYETDFHGEDGQLPANWVAMSSDEIIAIMNNRLHLSREGRPGTGAARTVMFQQSAAASWTNYVIEGTFRQSRTGNTNERNGLLARWNGARSLPVTAYYAYVSGNELFIAFGAGRGNETTEVLVREEIDGNFRANRSYTLRFSVVGENLSAELFDARGNSMVKAETKDDRLPRGSFGFQAYFSFGERSVDYEHLVVYLPR